MKVKYDVVIEKAVRKQGAGRPRSEESLMIMQFIKTNHTNMVFEYDGTEECCKRRASIFVTIKRENWPLKTKVVGNKLYIIREQKEENKNV